MKKVIYRLPEKLAYDFKVMCAVLGTSQQSIIEDVIKQFLEKQNAKPESKSRCERTT
jgi:hypothetical protein